MILTLLLVLVIFVFYKWITWNYDYFERKGINSIKPIPLFGNNGWMFCKIGLLDFILETYNKFSDDRASRAAKCKQSSAWVVLWAAVITKGTFVKADQQVYQKKIFNAAAGLLKSNPVITTFQVFSRVMVVCGVVMATPDGKASPGLPLALLAWSITEIIRYGYYALNIINTVPYLVVWLRYTTFIALYPIAVTGELLCFYWAQHYVKNNSIWTVKMPNTYNFTFSYFYFLWTIMLLYIPLFPQMYLHMFAQRKKIIGGVSNKAKHN